MYINAVANGGILWHDFYNNF